MMHSTFIDEIKQQKEVEHTVEKYHQLLETWTEITPKQRQEILGVYICHNIAKAIGISPSDVDLHQSIQYLGIDSLIAVKLRNKVRNDWLVDLAAVKFLDDFTIANLVKLLDEQIEHNYSQAVNDDDWLEGEI